MLRYHGYRSSTKNETGTLVKDDLTFPLILQELAEHGEEHDLNLEIGIFKYSLINRGLSGLMKVVFVCLCRCGAYSVDNDRRFGANERGRTPLAAASTLCAGGVDSELKW